MPIAKKTAAVPSKSKKAPAAAPISTVDVAPLEAAVAETAPDPVVTAPDPLVNPALPDPEVVRCQKEINRLSLALADARLALDRAMKKRQ